MKASKCFWVALCLLVGNFSTELWAQKNLEAVVQKCIRFSKGKNTVSYSINVDEEELLLTVIENFDMPEEKDIEIRSSSDM